MVSFIRFLHLISRPRFIGYLAGPYAIGYVAGITKVVELSNATFIMHLLYFLWIANILLYGLNDYFDTDTDKYNKKKIMFEHKFRLHERKKLQLAICIALVISILLALTQNNLLATMLFLVFLIFSIFYSAPPVRLKARPFLDSSSNILYGLPAFIGYAQTTGTLAPPGVIFATFCWTSAMHLFSAIPDIYPDKKAGVTTTAVLLGVRQSLLLCSLLWFIAAWLTNTFVSLYPWSLLAYIYPSIPLFLVSNTEKVTSVYWKFPFITMTLGTILFFVFFFSKPYA